MARTARGTRDGSGPYRESLQSRRYGIGRRRLTGETCPVPRLSDGGAGIPWVGIGVVGLMLLGLWKAFKK